MAGQNTASHSLRSSFECAYICSLCLLPYSLSEFARMRLTMLPYVTYVCPVSWAWLELVEVCAV
jgi:lipid A disaccharide synthetase